MLRFEKTQWRGVFFNDKIRSSIVNKQQKRPHSHDHRRKKSRPRIAITTIISFYSFLCFINKLGKKKDFMKH